MYETDKIDLQIIDLLLENGRMPAAEITRRIGKISERVVRYRIQRMVDEEIIKFGAIVNPKKFGFNIVADVFIEAETGSIAELAQKLRTYESVSYVAFSLGETDLSVQVMAHDAVEVYNFVTEVIGKVPGVRKTTTSIVPVVIKDVYQWRPPQEKT
jgi:Lrp/AsnC family transcriptional regulator for asnA, asnC and gidA